MVQYKPTSPYFTTPLFGSYLDILDFRAIRREATDVTYQIQEVYAHRPDLLAHDLYKDAGLWWVFMNRNPNRLKDPIWDFIPGITIFIPKIENINDSLGL